MNSLVELAGLLVVLGVGLFIIMALLSPFESLGWWAGWSKRSLDRELAGAERELLQAGLSGRTAPAVQLSPFSGVYLVYLRGIATAEAAPSRREQGFLDALAEYLPGSTCVADVFPYSATNTPLTAERAFARLYRLLSRARERYRNSLFSLIFIVHNLFQVGVSGDRRYGPIYNAGMAREIARSLVRHGYTAESQDPIWVLGWSGAGQIAVGAAQYLHQLFHAQVYVVSIGGVILDEPGIAEIAHLYHLEGSRDSFPRLGDVLSPGRWPIIKRSAWNRALDEGRITFVDPGPMRHTGGRDYFDHQAVLPDGKSYARRTAQVIAEIIRDEFEPHQASLTSMD